MYVLCLSLLKIANFVTREPDLLANDYVKNVYTYFKMNTGQFDQKHIGNYFSFSR